MHMVVQISAWGSALIYFVYILGSRISGSYGNSKFNFFDIVFATNWPLLLQSLVIPINIISLSLISFCQFYPAKKSQNKISQSCWWPSLMNTFLIAFISVSSWPFCGRQSSFESSKDIHYMSIQTCILLLAFLFFPLFFATAAWTFLYYSDFTIVFCRPLRIKIT